MTIIDRKRKRKESIVYQSLSAQDSRSYPASGSIRSHTEDKLLGRCEHVEGESDFILIAFSLEPTKEA